MTSSILEISAGFNDDNVYTINTDQVYAINMTVLTQSQIATSSNGSRPGQETFVTGGSLTNSAFVDPSYEIAPGTQTADQYAIYVSPGVSDAVPEASTCAMVLAGFGGLAFCGLTRTARAGLCRQGLIDGDAARFGVGVVCLRTMLHVLTDAIMRRLCLKTRGLSMRSVLRILICLALPSIMLSENLPALAVTDFGKGRPITAKDLAGKTICWSDGTKETFAANGVQTSSLGGRRKWSVLEPGVLLVGRRHTQMEITSDGRFLIHRFCGSCGRDVAWWGTPCS